MENPPDFDWKSNINNFENELETLINKYSIDVYCKEADYKLAKILMFYINNYRNAALLAEFLEY